MKVVFIGGGNMASALIAGALHAGLSSDDLTVVETNAGQREILKSLYGVGFAVPGDLSISKADCIVWAVKPQHLLDAIVTIAPATQSALHVSIAAGIRANLLARWLENKRVVRAMPNSAASVGSGVTGLFALDAVSFDDRQLVESFFEPSGSVHWVESDDRIDALTAVSGSGPAYLFHFLESFQSAAEDLGFPPDIARSLTLETAYGAVKQVQSGQESVSTLRSRVTSTRGTTEAGLSVLAKRETSAALSEAVREAYTRATEIADEWELAPFKNHQTA